jgi:hypothetical protein
MSLIKLLLTEITYAKEQALKNIYDKKYFIPSEDTKQMMETIPSLRDGIDEGFDLILSLDKTPNNSYTSWLLQKGLSTYTKTTISFTNMLVYEDILRNEDDITNALTVHLNNKNKPNFPKEYKDINSVNSLEDLYTIIKPFDSIVGDMTQYEFLIKTDPNEESYRILFESDKVLVVKPITEQGACLVGSKSEWCTTWGEHSYNPKFKKRSNHFDTYQSDSDNQFDLLDDLITFLNKKDDDLSYQIKIYKNEFKDLNNTHVEPNDIYYNLDIATQVWLDGESDEILSKDSFDGRYKKIKGVLLNYLVDDDYIKNINILNGELIVDEDNLLDIYYLFNNKSYSLTMEVVDKLINTLQSSYQNDPSKDTDWDEDFVKELFSLNDLTNETYRRKGLRDIINDYNDGDYEITNDKIDSIIDIIKTAVKKSSEINYSTLIYDVCVDTALSNYLKVPIYNIHKYVTVNGNDITYKDVVVDNVDDSHFIQLCKKYNKGGDDGVTYLERVDVPDFDSEDIDGEYINEYILDNIK